MGVPCVTITLPTYATSDPATQYCFVSMACDWGELFVGLACLCACGCIGLDLDNTYLYIVCRRAFTQRLSGVSRPAHSACLAGPTLGVLTCAEARAAGRGV